MFFVLLPCWLVQKLVMPEYHAHLIRLNILKYVLFWVGQLVGFVVGAIPLARKALIGESAPLHVIQDSASLLGYDIIAFGTHNYFVSV